MTSPASSGQLLCSACPDVLVCINKTGVLLVTHLINELVMRTEWIHEPKEITTVPSTWQSTFAVICFCIWTWSKDFIWGKFLKPLKGFWKGYCFKTVPHNLWVCLGPFVLWLKAKFLPLSHINPELQGLEAHFPSFPRSEFKGVVGSWYKADVIRVPETISR